MLFNDYHTFIHTVCFAITQVFCISLIKTAGYIGKARGVSGAAEKFANMTVSSKVPPPMKAGGWHGKSDFVGRSQQLLPGGSYIRKVAG